MALSRKTGLLSTGVERHPGPRGVLNMAQGSGLVPRKAHNLENRVQFPTLLPKYPHVFCLLFREARLGELLKPEGLLTLKGGSAKQR